MRTRAPQRSRYFAQVPALLAVVVIATVVLAGCTAPRDPIADCLGGEHLTVSGPLVIAVAAHENAPAPGLPEQLMPLLQATLAAGQPVRVIAIDGTPELLPATSSPISVKTCDGFTTSLNNAVAAVSRSIAGATADADGDNLYEAIALAADTANGRPATVAVIDSGLADDTGGPLDFTREGMTLADPDAAAEFAAAARPLDLSGLTFHLLLGHTAPPQEPLSGTERDNVTEIWATTINLLGADEVIIVSAPRPDEGPDTDYRTIPAPVAQNTTFVPPGQSSPTVVVFHEDRIRFLPDSTALADPPSARAALADIAAWLAASPGHHITITGTTSSAGTEDGRLQLSRHRAVAVAQLLLDDNAGIGAVQVSTEGVGTHFAGYIDDRRDDGSLDPLIAPANRTVRVTAHTAN